MSKTKLLSHILLALSIGAYVAFVRFGHLADAAMDKSGIGDLPAFEHYSNFAGISFWALLIFWVLSVAFIQASPQPYRSRALFVVGLIVPVIFIIGYVVVLTL